MVGEVSTISEDAGGFKSAGPVVCTALDSPAPFEDYVQISLSHSSFTINYGFGIECTCYKKSEPTNQPLTNHHVIGISYRPLILFYYIEKMSQLTSG